MLINFKTSLVEEILSIKSGIFTQIKFGKTKELVSFLHFCTPPHSLFFVMNSFLLENISTLSATDFRRKDNQNFAYFGYHFPIGQSGKIEIF